MRMSFFGTFVAGCILASTTPGCGTSTSSPGGASSGAGAASSGSMSEGGGSGNGSQTPPIGATAVTAWLATGAYKNWHCETASHSARSPSPHSVDRVCSNDVIANNATGSAPWPQGAAAVKELYTATTDAAPGGYAVYLKTQADSASGANWYFYGALTAGGTTVDGMGNDATVMATCTSCHLAAGSDAAHTPSPGGRDEVYTPVH
jgi:cytochrome P460